LCGRKPVRNGDDFWGLSGVAEVACDQAIG
jgi:hypothetical protein